MGSGERGRPDVKPDIEARAIITSHMIAGLRERLWHQDVLMHPKVLGELRALFEQVWDLFGLPAHGNGRHRAVDDEAGHEDDGRARSLKPDPRTATSVAGFMETLRLYKAWSGDPSWRTIADQAGRIVSHSTIYGAMNSNLLPKPEVVKAVITGCAGTQADVDAFLSARQRIASPKGRRRPLNTSSSPREHA
jgi:hypothetical protein